MTKALLFSSFRRVMGASRKERSKKPQVMKSYSKMRIKKKRHILSMMVLVMNQVAARRCLTRQRRRFEAVGTLVCTIGQNDRRGSPFVQKPSFLGAVRWMHRKGKEHLMFGKLNEQAASALLSLEPGDCRIALSWRSASSTWASRAIRRAMRCARSLRAASWRRSTRRGKRMQSNVEAVFGSGRRRMICSVSSASCGRLLVLFVFPM
mgnify:CR=1 FL=1